MWVTATRGEKCADRGKFLKRSDVHVFVNVISYVALPLQVAALVGMASMEMPNRSAMYDVNDIFGEMQVVRKRER